MYQNPTLFPEISNRESWNQTIQIFDDDTGDQISLTDDDGNPIYQVYMEIRPPRTGGRGGYNGPSPWYDSGHGEAIIVATLANYITIPDIGTIAIMIPTSVMRTLRGGLTYEVFLRLEDQANDDARQLLIGRIPVFYGGGGP